MKLRWVYLEDCVATSPQCLSHELATSALPNLNVGRTEKGRLLSDKC